MLYIVSKFIPIIFSNSSIHAFFFIFLVQSFSCVPINRCGTIVVLFGSETLTEMLSH